MPSIRTHVKIEKEHPSMHSHYRTYLEYVRNTNGGATHAHFVDDWDPVGDQLWQELTALGYVTDDDGRMRLTPAGVNALAAATP